MSENEAGQERTEQPTPKRLNEAKKKGQVPRSKELNTLVGLLFAAAGLMFLGGQMMSGLSEILKNSLSINPAELDNQMILVGSLVTALEQALFVLLPLFLLLTVGAFVGPLSLGGWAFSLSALAFKIDKVNPLKGIKKIFSAKSLMELLKAIGKFILVASAATAVIYAIYDQLLA